MTDDTQTTYSGDVTLAGSETPPVELHDPADVFVAAGSVDGDLSIRNAEYVYTHHPIDPGDRDGGENGDGRGDANEAPSGTHTTLRGDIEDGYVERVAGDVTVVDAQDVFVAGDAVAGDLTVAGAENVFADDAVPPTDPGEFDVATVGWRQSGSASDPETGAYAVGMDHEITLSGTRRDVDVYLVGHGHEVRVDGRGAAVSVHFLGRDNAVSVGPYLAADVVVDTGADNRVDAEPYPVEDLIETSRREAYANAGFGRRKVTFQEPADEEWCPNCGREADAIVERRRLEAFFVFSHPLRTYERSTNPACECEHCSPNAVSADLSPEERREVLE